MRRAPRSFDYARPRTVDEAVDLASRPGAAPLAGGTDFVTMRQAGVINPALVIDLKHVPPLAAIEREGATLRFGAAATMNSVVGAVGSDFAALSDGASVVGAYQTRNRATLGGNVCRASPAGDTLAPLIVLDATARVNGKRGSREVALSDFFTGPGRTVLEDGELLTSLELEAAGGASAYRRFTYRSWMDLAVVGVAVWLTMSNGTCTDARIAISGAAPMPLPVPAAGEALVETTLGPDATDEAAAAVIARAKPIDDVRGTREHRLRALGVLTRRVVATAAARTRQCAT